MGGNTIIINVKGKQRKEVQTTRLSERRMQWRLRWSLPVPGGTT